MQIIFNEKNSLIKHFFMRFWIIIGLLSWCTANTCAQVSELEQVALHELKGKWVGTLTQEAGGLASEYTFEVVINIENDSIKGYSTIELNGTKGKINLTGTIDGLYVQIEEIRLASKDWTKENTSWCIKTMKLNLGFKRGKFRLEGPWSGFSNKFKGRCSPGNIYLKKEAIRA